MNNILRSNCWLEHAVRKKAKPNLNMFITHIIISNTMYNIYVCKIWKWYLNPCSCKDRTMHRIIRWEKHMMYNKFFWISNKAIRQRPMINCSDIRNSKTKNNQIKKIIEWYCHHKRWKLGTKRNSEHTVTWKHENNKRKYKLKINCSSQCCQWHLVSQTLLANRRCN